MAGWIGVDLDGTLARHEHDLSEIGPPIRPMVKRVKRWLEEGREVRIVTARAYLDSGNVQRRLIEKWCKEHLGEVLKVTDRKDYGMIELWDDRAVQVRRNSGEPVDPLRRYRDG